MKWWFTIFALLILVSCKQEQSGNWKTINVSEVKDEAKWFFDESLVALPLNKGFLTISKNEIEVKVWLLSNPEKKSGFIGYKHEVFDSDRFVKTVTDSIDLLLPENNGFGIIKVTDEFSFTIIWPHAIQIEPGYRYEYIGEKGNNIGTNANP